MKELHDFTCCLLDDDGSCRNLTFERSSWEGLGFAIEMLSSSGRIAPGHDDEGREIERPFRDAISELAQDDDPGCLWFPFADDGAIVRQGSIFISGGEGQPPIVDFAFFPEDVKIGLDIRAEFLAWAEGLRATLQAIRYFLRYENASWELGDDGPTSGVFLVSDEHDGV